MIVSKTGLSFLTRMHLTSTRYLEFVSLFGLFLPHISQDSNKYFLSACFPSSTGKTHSTVFFCQLRLEEEQSSAVQCEVFHSETNLLDADETEGGTLPGGYCSVRQFSAHCV